MQGTIRCVLVAGLVSACDPGDTVVPDAPPVIGDSGLVLEWSSSPAEWPSANIDGVTLERARFALDTLRVVGDAAPGDPRTTASAIEMGFAWSDMAQRPEAIGFDEAPPGLYSQVAISFDGHSSGDAYEIRGRVVVGGEEYDYRIEDSSPLEFNVAIDEMLSPGEQGVISLRINFSHALDAVDWENVDTSDGNKELEDGDSQMAVFRTNLIESFEIVSASSVR